MPFQISTLNPKSTRSSSAARILLLALLAIAASHPSVTAQDADIDRLSDSWTFNLYLENDLIAGTDRNYTNGTKLSWISPDVTRFRDVEEAVWLQGFVSRLPYINKDGLQRNVVVSLGQNMYTPENISATDFIPDDRPYGGWLYLGFGFHSKTTHVLDSWEINLGIVGPYSFAADTQKFVHAIIDSPRPKGWHHQIGTEPGVNFVYVHKKRFFELGADDGWKVEAFRHYGGSLGNVAAYLNAGLELRAGWRLPSDFGSSLIRMAGESGSPTSSRDPRYLVEDRQLGFAIDASVDARVVGRDIFLDGNTFRDSPSLDKEPYVGDATLGASILYRNWKFSFTQVFRTRQFDLQDNAHSFGSLNLSYVY